MAKQRTRAELQDLYDGVCCELGYVRRALSAAQRQAADWEALAEERYSAYQGALDGLHALQAEAGTLRRNLFLAERKNDELAAQHATLQADQISAEWWRERAISYACDIEALEAPPASCPLCYHPAQQYDCGYPGCPGIPDGYDPSWLMDALIEEADELEGFIGRPWRHPCDRQADDAKARATARMLRPEAHSRRSRFLRYGRRPHALQTWLVRERIALSRHTGWIATRRELRSLRAFAADWDMASDIQRLDVYAPDWSL